MATQIPPIPQKTPLVDKNGMITEAWNKWFITLFNRVGNGVQPGSGSLGAQITSVETTLQSEIDGLSQGPQL